MKFYISWTNSDPIFSNYFNDCNMLISPHNTTSNFKLTSIDNYPMNIIIDSGAYYYLTTKNKLPSQKYVFERQMKMIKDYNGEGYICQLDQPVSPDKPTIEEVFSAVEKTLCNSYEFLELYNKSELGYKSKLKPMGVIQGNDKNSIQFCASELKRVGYKKFGLGSLAPLFNKDKIIERIKFAVEIVGGENLHIFGISRMDTLVELKNLNIASFDSSRPIKSAIFNKIFYSNPFRTYMISKAKNSVKVGSVLDGPLKCECPICKKDPYLMFDIGRKKYVNARAMHNYYHMLKEIQFYQSSVQKNKII